MYHEDKKQNFDLPSNSNGISIYNTMTIGTQTWMAENLKTIKYLNGDLIGTTSSPTLDITSESTPKYQWAYAGDPTNADTYGRLYTWFATMEIT
ncbi:MAG TPA: FISUMP domain-containing protein [Ignavibacteria bacterium]